jgi:putative ABC transport system substrate-binding protein
LGYVGLKTNPAGHGIGRMSARVLVSLLVFGVLAAPPAAQAQQGEKVWRIGLLDFAPAPSLRQHFHDGLLEPGYVEGKNVVFEFRYASPDLNRFPALAAELVAAGVDVIVATGNEAILAAKSVTTTIPIVMTGVFEPVEAGIATSLARPGGNVTGLTWEEPGLLSKRLQLFKQLVPTVSRMAVVWAPDARRLARVLPPLRTAANTLRMEIYTVDYSSVEQLDRVFPQLLKDRPSAILFVADLMTYPQRQAICDFALKNRFPTVTPALSWTEAGCLISYSPDMTDRFRRVAMYVDKILKGAKPADLPIEQPTKYQLVINGKTAKALGLTIPQSLLLQADRVIQ